MSELNISTEDIELLILSSAYEKSIKEEIINEFEGFKKGEPYANIPKRISEHTGLPYDEANGITNAIISILSTKEVFELSNNEIQNQINEYIKDDEDYKEVDIPLLNEWALKILEISNPNPLITAQAYSLAVDNSNLYLHSKVQEELRPIFLKNELAGLALYHTLVIHYKGENGNHKNLFLSLDTDDLENMIESFTTSKERIQALKLKYGSDIIHI